MTPSTIDKTNCGTLDALLALMERLEVLHFELRQALRTKLETMRDARLDDLHECVRREQALAERIGEQEGLRKQLMAKLGRAYGLAPSVARKMPARTFAERLDGPYRERFNEAADRLKTAVRDVKRANEMIGRVSAQVLTHVSNLFSDITAPEADRAGYTKKGHPATGVKRELFEAIG